MFAGNALDTSRRVERRVSAGHAVTLICRAPATNYDVITVGGAARLALLLRYRALYVHREAGFRSKGQGKQ
jgi:hypothetical protein